MTRKREDRIRRLERQLAETRIRFTNTQAQFIRLRRAVEEGLLVPRRAVEQDAARRASTFRALVQQVVAAEVEALTRLVEGDTDFVPDISKSLEDILEEWFDRFAKARSWKARVPAELAERAQAARRRVLGALIKEAPDA